MSSFAPSTATLALLRHVPEVVLRALVEKDDYRAAVVSTNAPLPETVFEYLFCDGYLDGYFSEKSLVNPRDLLYARPLSATQRALMFTDDCHPSIRKMYIERFFTYNMLTHDELRALTSDMLTKRASMDLIRLHRNDEVALGLIIDRLPEGTVISIANPGMTAYDLVPRRFESKFRVDDLTQYLRGLVDMEIETFESSYPPFPLNTALGKVGHPESPEQVKSYLKSGLAISPFDAAPLTAVLGENPATWIRFLSQLDYAGPTVTSQRVAATSARSKTAPQRS